MFFKHALIVCVLADEVFAALGTVLFLSDKGISFSAIAFFTFAEA